MGQASSSTAREMGLKGPLRITEGITRGDMATLLEAAAKDAESIIAMNLNKPGIGAMVRNDQLNAAINGLGQLSSDMWDEIGSMTRKGIYASASLSADQQLDRDFLSGMPYSALQQYAPGMYFNAMQSAEDIISRRTEGFALSERIYRNAGVGVAQAGKIVETGLALQMSAKEIAARVRGLYNPDVPGGQSYAAMRLARTEINNAHHSTTIRLSKNLPWVEGYQWNLSGSHPKIDVCDDLAGDDSDNMGPGAYAKDNVPDKPHPHCLCYIEVIQPDPDEFMNRLMSGEFDSPLEDMGVECG